MAFTNNGKHVMLNALGAVAVKASLHDDDPSTNGANEVSGGSPAYAKKTIAWDAAADGEMDKAADPAVVFDVPTGTTVKYVGFWNSAADTFYGSAAVTNEVFAAQGTYTLLNTTKLDIDDPA